MNFHNVHLVFPLKIKKKTNVANNILVTEITVNNFFANWIKEIDIKRLGDDTPILPTTNTVEIYKYSDAILKHIPRKALAVIENDLLYSKKRLNCQLVKIGVMSVLTMRIRLKERTIILKKELKNFMIN